MIGGLVRFMAYWAKEARQEAGSDTAADEVDHIVDLMTGYDGLEIAERRQRVDQALAILQQSAQQTESRT